MGRKEKFEQAIAKGDLESIRECFKSIYGEDPPLAPNMIEVDEDNSVDNDKIKQLLNIINNGIDRIKNEIDSLFETKDVDIVINNNDDVKENSKIQFISETDDGSFSKQYEKDPGIKKSKKKYDEAVKKRQTRPKYKEKLVKCQCGHEFDYNKEYPVGKLDPEAPNLCHKCKKR